MYRIFDAHCDTLNKLMEKGENLTSSTGMVSAPMMKAYPGYIQIFAAWVDRSKTDNPLLSALTLSDSFHREISQNGIKHIDSKKSLGDVLENGGYGAILSLENGVALCGKVEMTDVLYRLGFRVITLTWNGSNELGDGAVGSPQGGLTAFGKEVVERMNSLGMVIDVSHLSEKGFYDVADISKMPFTASHSNTQKYCSHPRNLSDEQIKTIIDTNGVIGINLYSEFLSDTGEANISDVVKHIEHILSLGGENNIGIGTDFDGISKSAKGLENIACLKNLVTELERLGYSTEIIEKFTHRNFENLFYTCL